MSDFITLPREVAEHLTKMLEECPLLPNEDWSERDCAALTTLRARLAAPCPEPVAWHYRNNGGASVMHWGPSAKLDADMQAAKDYPNVHKVTPLYTAPPAAAPEPEPVRHPGYILGNHWLETAYERLCAGEAEDAILEDYELVREPRLRELRRDAERYNEMLTALSVAADASTAQASQPATEPASRAREDKT